MTRRLHLGLAKIEMKLKQSYSAREVATLTGLSARQLQWWNSHQMFQAAVASRRTEAGGFTERRYSPVELYELVALADLRKRGFSVQKLRAILKTLRKQFNVRLFDTLDDGAEVTLLTDGQDVFARTKSGEFFNLLRSPEQPLLVVGNSELRALSSHVKVRRRRAVGKKSKKDKPVPKSKKKA